MHADRRDESCHMDDRGEGSVEREAAMRAMPLATMEWAFTIAETWHTAAALLKLPEDWVRWWVDAMHPAARELVWRASTAETRVHSGARGHELDHLYRAA